MISFHEGHFISRIKYQNDYLIKNIIPSNTTFGVCGIGTLSLFVTLFDDTKL